MQVSMMHLSTQMAAIPHAVAGLLCASPQLCCCTAAHSRAGVCRLCCVCLLPRFCDTADPHVQVHRIQNKKLWNAFAHSQACMKERWSHEPSLPLINGGHPTLWHGTSRTEPYKIYGAELGPFLILTGIHALVLPAALGYAVKLRQQAS